MTDAPAPIHPSPAPAKSVRRRGCLAVGIGGLVGFILLGLLGSLVPSGDRGLYARNKKARAQAVTLAQLMVNAIKHYYTEYARYPIASDSDHDEVTPLRTTAGFTAVLMGTDRVLNPRRIKFLPEVPQAGPDGRAGLKSGEGGLSLLDPWGEAFYVILDVDYSGEIDNPDPTSPPRKLSQGVLVFSAGLDKDPSTWEDNLISWPQRPR